MEVEYNSSLDKKFFENNSLLKKKLWTKQKTSFYLFKY
jgi:hypothetical protein